MTSLHLWQAIVAFASAFAAGAINSVAGGGTLLSFPALIWVGLNSVTANATSTVAIWPGSVGSLWGYRREMAAAPSRIRLLVIPSLIGGIIGAQLLRWTPTRVFDQLVPFLILFATFLFLIQERVQRLLKSTDAAAHQTRKWFIGAMLFQLCVGVYGGYFGAGMGILMLAALSIIGLQDIHQMNGLKALFGMAANGIAAFYFVYAGMVVWYYVAIMVVGALAGGWGGAGIARKIGGKMVRRIVVVVGFGMAASLLLWK